MAKLLIVGFFLIGLAVLGLLVWQVGLSDLLVSLRAVGPWILPFILLESLPIFVHVLAWGCCFTAGQPAVGYWRLGLVRLAGRAMNQMTPTATIGGEIVKVLLLTPLLPREQAVAAVVIDKASYALAQTLHLAVGTLYVTSRLALPAELRFGLTCTISAVLLGLVGFIALQRYGLLSKCLLLLCHYNIGRARLSRWHQHLVPLEARFATYYTAHPWRFVGSLLLHVLAFAFGSVQTFLLLKLLLGSQAPGLADAIAVTVAVSALDQAFFFVPGGVGALEGARFTVLSALGVAQVYGLAFGLIIRLENLCWNGLGLLAYAWCMRTWPPVVADRAVAPHAADLSPTPRRASQPDV